MGLKRIMSFFLICLLEICGIISAQTYSSYLFVYFTGNSGSQESVRFAVSDNGFEYLALNNNEPILSSATISSTGGIRDPHILRGVDNKTFYMVMTDMKSANGWSSNHGIVMLKSTNLVDWTYSKVDIHVVFPKFNGVNRMWAPQTIYDPEKKKYMVYFAMRSGDDQEVIYYSYANDDFTTLETSPEVLFIPENKLTCIDPDIILKDGVYHLFVTTQGNGTGIKQALSKSVSGGYKVENDVYIQPDTVALEGSCVFKLINEDTYLLIYDMNTSGKYQFTESKDLLTFKVTTRRVSHNFTPRHGTVMTITAEERERIVKKWGITS
jgi:hypothetical protein